MLAVGRVCDVHSENCRSNGDLDYPPEPVPIYTCTCSFTIYNSYIGNFNLSIFSRVGS